MHGELLQKEKAYFCYCNENYVWKRSYADSESSYDVLDTNRFYYFKINHSKLKVLKTFKIR